MVASALVSGRRCEGGSVNARVPWMSRVKEKSRRNMVANFGGCRGKAPLVTVRGFDDVGEAEVEEFTAVLPPNDVDFGRVPVGDVGWIGIDV